MSSNLPDFEKADYLAPSTTPAYTQQPIVSGGVDVRAWEAQNNDHARFTKAITYGIGAAIVGSILYAAFGIITHIMIGYVAIGVGYLVGKAMLTATGGHSSRKYQVAAAVLTYLSVSFAAVPEILWALHSDGKNISHISARVVICFSRDTASHRPSSLCRIEASLLLLASSFFSSESATPGGSPLTAVSPPGCNVLKIR